MIKIHLREEYEFESKRMIAEYYNQSKVEEITAYMKNVSDNFPDIETLCCEKKVPKLSVFIWYLKRFILDFYNLISMRKKAVLTPSVSKATYEDIATTNFQLDKSASEIVSLINGKLYYTTLWDRRIAAARDFMNEIEKLEASSILEVGCGEGIVLFTMLQLEKDFLNNRNWIGFDFSVATALNCKILFENMRLSKDVNIDIYNGDATAIHFEHKKFDVAICNSVLDQIKYDKLTALSEMARVSRYMIIREPLFERQTVSGKLHFMKNDYCQLSLDDLKKFGSIVSLKHCELADPTYSHSLIVLKTF